MLDVWTITEAMDVCATPDMKVMEEYAQVTTIFFPKISIYFSNVSIFYLLILTYFVFIFALFRYQWMYPWS